MIHYYFSIAHQSILSFKERIGVSLPSQQKKILSIVSVAFACLTAAYACKCYFAFKARKNWENKNFVIDHFKRYGFFQSGFLQTGALLDKDKLKWLEDSDVYLAALKHHGSTMLIHALNDPIYFPKSIHENKEILKILFSFSSKIIGCGHAGQYKGKDVKLLSDTEWNNIWSDRSFVLELAQCPYAAEWLEYPEINHLWQHDPEIMEAINKARQ